MSDASPSPELPPGSVADVPCDPRSGPMPDRRFDPLSDPISMVRDWAARCGPEVDPVRLSTIEGLARRASAQQGLARDRMLQRLAQWMAQASGVPEAVPATDAPAAAPPATGLASLSALVDRLGRMTPAKAVAAAPPAASARPSGAGVARRPTASATRPPPSAALARAVPPQPLKAVAAYQGTWSRLRAEQRLRQALAQVPQKAGPLNSSHVVHRALKALHELSPAYLDAFMAHIDTLLALEQASGAGDLAAPRAAAAPEPARRPAARPRKG